MRGWIMAVTMDAKGDMVSMERFMPSTKFSNPIDLEFSPSGDMYMLEYGTGWFQQNPDARLVRIEYNGGNRAPVVVADVDKPAGPLPLAVALSSAGTAGRRRRRAALRVDDHGSRWRGGEQDRRANPTYTFDKPGIYFATLAVTDAKGARSDGARRGSSPATSRRRWRSTSWATARSTSRARRSATPRASPIARMDRSRAGGSPRTPSSSRRSI
jgi:cytochrome c